MILEYCEFSKHPGEGNEFPRAYHGPAELFCSCCESQCKCCFENTCSDYVRSCDFCTIRACSDCRTSCPLCKCRVCFSWAK